MRLHVDENGAELASTFERKVVDSKLEDLSDWPCGQGHDTPENGEPARLDAHAICDTHAKSAASRQANGLYHLKEACGHPRPGGNKGGQTLGKDFSWTGWAHRRKISPPRAGSARVVQYWGGQPVYVDSDYGYEWQQSHTRDNERWVAWTAEIPTGFLLGESMR